MRHAGVTRYLMAVTVVLLMAACAEFTGMRTAMPPPPAEAPPGTAPSAAPSATPDLAQQVENLAARVQHLESQVAQLERRTAPAAPAKARPQPAPAAASSPKPVAAAPAAASDKSYAEGMRLYHAKKYAEARNQLHQYLKNHPKGPKAPEARYYLADSFYQEGKHREAAVEFNKLRLQFPKSILAPAGLLRQALCYKNLQQMSPYRDTLSKLVKAYPNSPEAKEAQKMLKESPKEASR